MIPPLERIAAGIPALKPAQRPVARFFVEHAERLGFYSAADIAALLATSDATVVRTAQALGFDGLADLKRALRAEVTPEARMAATLTHAAGPADVLAHVLAAHRAALDRAQERLAVTFPAAVRLLGGAERVVVSGTGPSGAVAGYAALLFGRIGRPAAAFVGTGLAAADEALGLRTGDVLLLLAYTRLHRHAEVLVEVAGRCGVPVLLVTDVLTAVPGVDLVLTCPRGVPDESSSHAVTLLLVEALVVALAAADRPRASAALQELNRVRAALLDTPVDVDVPDRG